MFQRHTLNNRDFLRLESIFCPQNLHQVVFSFLDSTVAAYYTRIFPFFDSTFAAYLYIYTRSLLYGLLHQDLLFFDSTFTACLQICTRSPFYTTLPLQLRIKQLPWQIMMIMRVFLLLLLLMATIFPSF